VINVKWSLKDPPQGENQLSSQMSDALRVVSVAAMFFVATVDEWVGGRMDGRTDGASLIGTARVFGRPKLHYQYVRPPATPRVPLSGFSWTLLLVLLPFVDMLLQQFGWYCAISGIFSRRRTRVLCANWSQFAKLHTVVKKVRTKIVCSTHSSSRLEIRVSEGVR